MKRKIAYCLPSLYIPGGMERVLTIKANYFADVLGYDIYIILTDGIDKKPYYKLSEKVHVINLDINFDELWNKRFIHKSVLYLKKQHSYKIKLKKALYTIRPDITVSMLRREINFISSIKDGSLKIGEIHINKDNFRNFDKKDYLKKILSKIWLKKLILELKKINQFIVLTTTDKEKWDEIDNVKVIPNPLPFYPQETSNCEAKKVIAVGRFVQEKGFDLLIESWSYVNKKHPDWELHIYGDGEREQFTKQISSLNISDSCILEPVSNNIIKNYCESSILALSSRFEGFGLVICEAMACGIPAIAFDCPWGPRDIIKNNTDGLLVENGNTKKLAEKICYLIENEEVRKNMGRQAKINVERYKIENIALQWKELFESLIDSHKSDTNLHI